MRAKYELPEAYSIERFSETRQEQFGIYQKWLIDLADVFDGATTGTDGPFSVDHGDIYGARIDPAIIEFLLNTSAQEHSYMAMANAGHEGKVSMYTRMALVYLESSRRVVESLAALQPALEASKQDIAEREAALNQAVKDMPPLAEFLKQSK